MGSHVLPAVPEAVAVAVHLWRVEVVRETVQQRAGQSLRPEDCGPFVEGQVGGDQDGSPLAALAEDLKEQFRPGGGQGHEAQFVDDQQAEAGQIPLEVEQLSLILGLQRPALPRFHRRDASARFPPNQGGCPGLLRGYDHQERGGWNVAQSVLVDVDALDDIAVLGAVHDLVLRVLGLVQRQSQLFHRFHLLVAIGGGKVYRVVHELSPENRFEPGSPARSAAPATGPSQVARLNQSLRVLYRTVRCHI